MECWFSLEICNTEENQQLQQMYRSGDKSNRDLAIQMSKNSFGRIHYNMYTDKNMQQLLGKAYSEGVRTFTYSGIWEQQTTYRWDGKKWVKRIIW